MTDEAAKNGPAKPTEPGPGVAAQYWKANVRILAVLLAVWAIVSFGCGIVFVEPLNRIRLGEAKLGFWFAQQGSIYVFVVLIALYVILLNRLERRLGLQED